MMTNVKIKIFVWTTLLTIRLSFLCLSPNRIAFLVSKLASNKISLPKHFLSKGYFQFHSAIHHPP